MRSTKTPFRCVVSKEFNVEQRRAAWKRLVDCGTSGEKGSSRTTRRRRGPTSGPTPVKEVVVPPDHPSWKLHVTALMPTTRRAGAQRPSVKLNGFDSANPAQCGPPSMSVDWHELAASLLDKLSVEEPSEMGEIVQEADTCVKRHGIRATILCKIASCQGHGIEFPGMRNPVERIYRKLARADWIQYDEDRHENVARMNNMSHQILNETCLASAGRRSTRTGRRSRNRSACKGPIGAAEKSEANFGECSEVEFQRHRSKREGEECVHKQHPRASRESAGTAWLGAHSFSCAPLKTPIHQDHLE